jgi:DNA polymerase-3 subunit delta'
MLEEPPATVYFILVSNRWRQLLPTIRSRCRAIMLPRPEKTLASQWLTEQGAKQALDLLPLTGFAPTLALAEHERERARIYADIAASLIDPSDPLVLAERWESHLKRKDNPLGMDDLVSLLQKWVHDLTVLQAAGAMRFFPDKAKAAEPLARRAMPESLLRFHSELIKIKALANHPLNPRLVLEDMAVRYLRALAPAR